MPVEINGNLYFKVSETCKRTGISRSTTFRWLKAGVLEKSYKDRRGWRIFTERDIAIIRAEARKNKVDLVRSARLIT